MHQECVAGLLRTGLASLFILVTPLLGLRLALRCRTLCAAFASTAPASFASKQCQSNIHNHSRIFHSPVRAQDRLIAQTRIISRMSTCALWEEQRLSRQDKERKLRLS